MTMRRWIKWYLENQTNIEGLLRHAFRKAGKVMAVSPEGSLFSFIREQTHLWLETIIRIIYNSGEVILTGSS